MNMFKKSMERMNASIIACGCLTSLHTLSWQGVVCCRKKNLHINNILPCKGSADSESILASRMGLCPEEGLKWDTRCIVDLIHEVKATHLVDICTAKQN